MTRKKVYVKNIPYEANEGDVIETLSSYGPISNCDLRPHRNRRGCNAGYGFVEFENEKDAKECIAKAPFIQPMCITRRLHIFPARSEKKVVKISDDTIEIKKDFFLSSLEIGNWGGKTPIRRGNRRGNRRNTAAESFTFLSEWKYPEYYEKPKIHFSKTEEAFILEGFNLPKFSNASSDSSDPFASIFGLLFDPRTLERRVKIPFRSLAEKRGIFLDVRNGVISLYISLKQPPYLYRKLSFLSSIITRGVDWIRTVDWTGIANVFGKCLVYKLIFKIDLDELRDTLANFKFRGIPRPMPQIKVKCIERPAYSKEYFDDLIYELLPFSLCFKLESLISYGILTPYEIEESNLIERLGELVHNEGQEKIAWYALNQISTKYWDPFDVKHQNRPISIFETAIRNFKSNLNVWYPTSPNLNLTNNSRCVWINHATITPTKIYFDGPNYEPSNRILRLYKDKADYFLRVTFKDENFDRLFVNGNEDVDIIKLRIVAIMNTGFHLVGRYYEFLAFSSSQLKEASCWFVASDGEFNADFIRANMGDLSNIRAPALYASRMGQCFTSTMGALKLDSGQIRRIEDIERNNYNFSDGCGKISPSLAKRVAKEYWGTRKPKDDEIPSVFQIRFGGCKGIVAVDQDLEGDVLCIRPSQIKFEAPDSSILEIVKIVKNPLPGHFNRQIIMLLSALGVPDHVFITLQNEMRADIDSMLTDEDKARKIVSRSTGPRECSHVTRTILSMIDAGLMRGTFDPFLKALLECKRIFALKLLRYKARILVPNSFLLIGVIDELGILEEDEIYVQTSTIVSEHQTFDTADEIHREQKIWTGPAVITRNPCLHPGDLRMAKAVDVPEFSHLRNCVVFSQKGDRPLPNLLSGGDLDGDQFFVSFDKRLFITKNEEPMNYDAPERKTLDRSVEVSDICEFFKDFMLSNRLGQISNLHLAYADAHEEGVKFIGCLKLAELHSLAVDFNKTGVPVAEALPSLDEYPDFMENKYKESYISEKVLGQLYRNIQLDKPESDPLLKYYIGKIIPNEDFSFDGFQHYVEEAIVYRDHYNGEIRNLMKKYKVKTEAEILTTQLLERQVEGRKSQDIREAISGTISLIIYNCRKQFLMGLQETNDDDDADDATPFNLQVKIPINDETKAKASAYYHVTYNQKEYPDQSGKTVLLSFPWIVAEVLLAIRRDKHLEEMAKLVRELELPSVH